jgi:hypothetical protein
VDSSTSNAGPGRPEDSKPKTRRWQVCSSIACSGGLGHTALSTRSRFTLLLEIPTLWIAQCFPHAQPLVGCAYIRMMSGDSYATVTCCATSGLTLQRHELLICNHPDYPQDTEARVWRDQPDPNLVPLTASGLSIACGRRRKSVRYCLQ